MVVALAPTPARRRLLSLVRTRAATLAGALLLAAPPAATAPLVLYDATLVNRPQDQPWLTYIAPLGPAATMLAAGTTVDTTNPGSTADDAGLLFLGDNTRSAAAAFTLGRVAIATGPFPADIPLPPVSALLAWGLILSMLAGRSENRNRNRNRNRGRKRDDPTIV